MTTMVITEIDRKSLIKELSSALVNFSFGKLNKKQADDLAIVAIKNIDFNNSALAHKGINWYAKKMIDIVDFSAFSTKN